MTYYDDYEDITELSRREVAHRAGLNRGRRIASLLTRKPKGWTVKWMGSRRHRFEIYPEKRLIMCPMPKTRRGLAVLELAINEAGNIQGAIDLGKTRPRQARKGSYSGAVQLLIHSYHGNPYYAERMVKDALVLNRVQVGGYYHNSYRTYTDAFIKRMVKCVARARLRAWRMPVLWRGLRADTINMMLPTRTYFCQWLGVPESRYPLPAGVKAALNRGQSPSTKP